MAVHRRLTVAAAVVWLAFGALGAYAATRTTHVVSIVVNDAGTTPISSEGLKDGVCDADLSAAGAQCTLQAAADLATKDGGAKITFDIPSVDPVITSRVAFPADTTIDGTTEPGYDGRPTVSVGGIGLEGDSTVRGLSIGTTVGGGITVAGNNDTIVGNYIGLAPDGKTVYETFGNSGIKVVGAWKGTTIGGADSADRNVIDGYGVAIDLEDGADLGKNANNVSDTEIVGNYIGVSPSGGIATGNQMGIDVFNAEHTIIGGSKPGEGNVISGSTGADSDPTKESAFGIRLQSSSRTSILGNRIGTDAAGKLDAGNAGDGIIVVGSTATSIGSSAGASRTACTGSCNLISGNGANGISVSAVDGTQASDLTVVGNFIGTDVSGTEPVGNHKAGIAISVSSGVSIGEITGETQRGCTGGCNVISGNRGDGILWTAGPAHAQTFDDVVGNFIGTDRTGTKEVANNVGIDLQAAGAVVVGSTDGIRPGLLCQEDCNLVSGNHGCGINVFAVVGRPLPSPVIRANVVGLDAQARLRKGLGNGRGICVTGAGGTVIGGTGSGQGNLVGGNFFTGVEVTGQARDTAILGNWIGVDGKGAPAPNGIGVSIESKTFGTHVGGTEGTDLRERCSGACNVISSNHAVGVKIVGSSSNHIEGNYVGVAPDGTRSGNASDGILVTPAPREASPSQKNVVGGLSADKANLISANGGAGVHFKDAPSEGGRSPEDGRNSVFGNLIGTNADGDEKLGNGVGVQIEEAFGETIGGTEKNGNLISGNTRSGILVNGSGNTISHNVVGLDRKKKHELSNGSSQIKLEFGQSNTITHNIVLSGGVVIEPAAKQENTYAPNEEVSP